MSQLKVDSIVPSGGVVSGADGGGIIQIVSVESTSQGSTTSTSFIDFPGLSATITPRSTSNKIFITASVVIQHDDYYSAFARLMRGSTKIFPNGSSTPSHGFGFRGGGANYEHSIQTFSYLDSPATTSATTYKIQINTANTSRATFYNRSILIDTNNDASGDTNNSGGYVSSTITLYEVSG